MHEIPDVEVFRKYLDSTSLHKRIDKCRVRDSDILEHISKERLQKTLMGYDAVRKLGRIGLTKDLESFADEKKLGMDALNKDLTFEFFQKTALKNTSGEKSL